MRDSTVRILLEEIQSFAGRCLERLRLEESPIAVSETTGDLLDTTTIHERLRTPEGRRIVLCNTSHAHLEDSLSPCSNPEKEDSAATPDAEK